MNLKRFPILKVGKKASKVKIENKKYEISYLSKKEYKQEVENQKKIGVETILLGYTNLKHKSDIDKNDDKADSNLVGVLTTDNVLVSIIEKKKKKLRYIRGYIYVGNNKYVAIQKFNPLFFLLLLLIGLICIGVVLGIFGNNIEPIKPWHPVLEEIVDVQDGEKNEISQIQVAGFSSWHIPAGQTENIPVSLKNPEGNPCYFSFDIKLKDTGDVLYTSKMVQPGDTIKLINLNKSLDAGKYTAIVHINTNELETGIEMNDASFEVELTVS